MYFFVNPHAELLSFHLRGSYEDFLERDIQILATLKLRGQNCTDRVTGQTFRMLELIQNVSRL